VQLREVKLFSLAVVRGLAPDLARCGRILWAHEDPMRTHAYKRPHGSARASGLPFRIVARFVTVAIALTLHSFDGDA
jgi:hypothetical protein